MKLSKAGLSVERFTAAIFQFFIAIIKISVLGGQVEDHPKFHAFQMFS